MNGGRLGRALVWGVLCGAIFPGVGRPGADETKWQHPPNSLSSAGEALITFTREQIRITRSHSLAEEAQAAGIALAQTRDVYSDWWALVYPRGWNVLETLRLRNRAKKPTDWHREEAEFRRRLALFAPHLLARWPRDRHRQDLLLKLNYLPEAMAFPSGPLAASTLCGGLDSDWTANREVLMFQVLGVSPSYEKSLPRQVVWTAAGNRAVMGVGWPGMMGFLSGINADGLTVFLARRELHASVLECLPITFLIRRVLEECSTPDEALAFLQGFPIAGDYAVLVGRAGSKSAFGLIKKEQGRPVCLVPPATPKMVLTSQRAADAAAGNMGEIDPGYHLAVCLDQRRGRMTTSGLVELLRKRTDLRGLPVPLGHNQAIDALNSIHAIVVNLNTRQVWVASPPHHLGSFQPFGIQPWLGAAAEILPADPLLASGDYLQFLNYHQGLREALRLFQQAEYRESLAWIYEMRGLNAGDYQAHLLAAQNLAALKRFDEALRNLRLAARCSPPREMGSLIRRREQEIRTAAGW
jgi:hypothetical protein